MLLTALFLLVIFHDRCLKILDTKVVVKLVLRCGILYHQGGGGDYYDIHSFVVSRWLRNFLLLFHLCFLLVLGVAVAT